MDTSKKILISSLKIAEYIPISVNGGNAQSIFTFQIKTVYLNMWSHVKYHPPPPHLPQYNTSVVYITFTFKPAPFPTPLKKNMIWSSLEFNPPIYLYKFDFLIKNIYKNIPKSYLLHYCKIKKFYNCKFWKVIKNG